MCFFTKLELNVVNFSNHALEKKKKKEPKKRKKSKKKKKQGFSLRFP